MSCDKRPGPPPPRSLLAQILVALALRTSRVHVGPPPLLLLLHEAAVEGDLEFVALTPKLGVGVRLVAGDERLDDVFAPRVGLEERRMHLLRHSQLTRSPV